MKKTKENTILRGVSLDQITDVASLFMLQGAYDAALYDTDCWGE